MRRLSRAAAPDVAAVARAAADPRDAQIARLRKEKARLEQELARARFVVDVQAKLQALVETIATYLLLRALADGRWRWWAAYGAAIVATGLFNLLALLLLAAHGVTVWVVHTRQRAARGHGEHAPAAPVMPSAMPVSRWLAAAGAATVVLSPLLVTGWEQRRQISWLARPGLRAVSNLVISFAGSNPLVPLMVLLVAAGVTATVASRPRAVADVVTVAVPWLMLPAAILLAASQVHPVYNARYIVYCLPALALLAATGLAGMTRLAMAIPLGKAGRVAAWLPTALILVLLAALVLGPQRSVRLASSRPDNLRMAAAIMAAHERRGDAVLYLPSNKRVFSMAYPAPYQRLRDIALAKSPVAAANLIGTEVPPTALQARFATVDRVWVVSRGSMRAFRHPARALDKTKVTLLKRFRLIQRWHTGQDILSLYLRG